MMVSPISFRATTATGTFQDLINKPQAYAETPAASSRINAGNKKKGKTGKTILGILAGAALAIGALVLGHKKGFFAIKEGEKAFVSKLKGYAETAGSKLCEWGKLAKDKITGLFGKIKPEKAAEVAEDAVEVFA